jgi:hypothetical protein
VPNLWLYHILLQISKLPFVVSKIQGHAVRRIQTWLLERSPGFLFLFLLLFIIQQKLQTTKLTDHDRMLQGKSFIAELGFGFLISQHGFQQILTCCRLSPASGYAE